MRTHARLPDVARRWVATTEAPEDSEALSTLKEKDAFEESNEWTDVAPWCSRSFSQNAGLWSFVIYGTKGLDDHGHQSQVQMEWIYRDIHTESMNANPSMKELSSGNQDFNTTLILEVLTKFSVVESAVAYRVTPDDPLSSPVMGLVASEFPNLSPFAYRDHLKSFVPGICKRYADVVAEDNWVLLSILSRSHTFRTAASVLNWKSWHFCVECINDNAVSLVVFTKVRNLDFETSLARVSRYLPLKAQETIRCKQKSLRPIQPGQPHAYVVAATLESVYQPRFNETLQINIDSNIYNPFNFTRVSKPDRWPEHLDYPADPTMRLLGEESCKSCLSEESCECEPSSCPLVTRPLVELKIYGSKGIGVRALQRIHKGDILGEYVGELWPANSRKFHKDSVYAYSIQRRGSPVDEEEIATVSAMKYGNWTRFINHSCKSSTDFYNYTVGRRNRVLVRASRDIDMFEEITIHYGDSYFGKNSRKNCECGEPSCTFSVGYKSQQTLRELDAAEPDYYVSDGERSGAGRPDIEEPSTEESDAREFASEESGSPEADSRSETEEDIDTKAADEDQNEMDDNNDGEFQEEDMSEFAVTDSHDDENTSKEDSAEEGEREEEKESEEEAEVEDEEVEEVVGCYEEEVEEQDKEEELEGEDAYYEEEVEEQDKEEELEVEDAYYEEEGYGEEDGEEMEEEEEEEEEEGEGYYNEEYYKEGE